jgi:hypothetical protein
LMLRENNLSFEYFKKRYFETRGERFKKINFNYDC